MKPIKIISLLLVFLFVATLTFAENVPGEGPALGDRITQDMVENDLSLKRIRKEGLRIFSTPFNLFDGLGDGPINHLDKVSPGGRPTLQNNGIFLRMNGLDSQTCLECHSILSNATIPATFAVGGVGAVSDSAFPGVIDPDIDDSDNNGFAAIQGRFINPPFSFGSGLVELLGKEMTTDLQALKDIAVANPDEPIPLVTKGVSFGFILFDSDTSTFDTSNVVGIDEDLVVRPFGRKGCCATIRDFDTGAMQFHHGIQPVDVVGEGVDADGDGVANELTVGELSALHIFQVALEWPVETAQNDQARNGKHIFQTIGCAECHVPKLRTNRSKLPVCFPEIDTDPFANIYKEIDLRKNPPKFKKKGHGVRVKLYSDLKRHNMGDSLAESTGSQQDGVFITARLWGIADTSPYLHDGRAVTLTDAILMHGGEAQAARDAFNILFDSEKLDLLAFLRTLRTPKNPGRDLLSKEEDD
jgi:hypothetical protein